MNIFSKLESFTKKHHKIVLNFISLQKLLSSFISSIFLHEASRRLGLKITKTILWALDIATFNLFLLKNHVLCLGIFAESEAV